jgi:hypothetical protein
MTQIPGEGKSIFTSKRLINKSVGTRHAVSLLMIENGSKVSEKPHNKAKLTTRFEDNLAVFCLFLLVYINISIICNYSTPSGNDDRAIAKL